MGWTYCLFLPWTFGLLWILVPAKCSPGLFDRWGDFEGAASESPYGQAATALEDEECMEPDYFKCHNGRCISSAFHCDNDNDCGDFSDEKDCSHETYTRVQIPACSNTSEFKCESDGVCIPLGFACDSYSDCVDSSDEIQGCNGKTICNGGFFCEAIRRCQPKYYQCDGQVDCLGGADEQNCSKTEVSHTMDNCTVENHKFQCKDKSMCIELHKLCDHTPDCLDRSDEGENCSKAAKTEVSHIMDNCTVENHKFQCKDKSMCIELHKLCDHTPDCLDRSDEGENCSKADGEGLLFYSTVTEIRGFNIKTDSHFPVATDLTQAVGVSCDGDYVYWTNIFEGQEAIVRSLKNGSDKSIIINSGLGTPEDLAVDLVTNNIYFTDSKMQHIAVCTNDGSACAVLHNKDIDKPRAICLQPDEGLMYWSDWGERPLIARSSMDGNDKADFVTTGIHWPNGITIDHGNGRLYWVDAKLRHIESIKLDGSDRRVVIADTISHPFSIAVFEDSLYWSDYEGMQIQSCNKFTGKNKQSIIQETKNSIFGIHIYHQPMRESLKIKIKNPCEDSGCSDICLLASLSKPLRYTCACPEGKTLASNGHYCRKGKNAGFDQTQILVERNLEWKKGMLGKKTIDKMELSGVEKIGALAYDSSTGNVIISDSIAKKILSVNFYNGKTTTLLSRDLGKIESLDVDPLAHNLYWVDSERLTVEVMSLKSLERTILMRDLGAEVPVDIVLAPHQGYMFISFSGPRGTHVDRFYMDGLSRRLHFVEDKNIDLN